MKKIILVVALAVCLVFALTATALATTGKTWNYQNDYYSWGMSGGDGTNGGTLGGGGNTGETQNSNPANPGVHANYTTTTAKCGICHSVHRAMGTGVHLLNTATATCAGCHVAPSTVTNVDIEWAAGGPHNSGSNATCNDYGCHVNSPHGAIGSQYALFRTKLLTVSVDAAVAAAAADPTNSGVTSTLLAGAGMDYNYTGAGDAVRAGYTCASAGCHRQTMLTVLIRGWAENRAATASGIGIPGTPPATTFTGSVSKTGHLSVATDGSTYPASYGNIKVAWAPATSCIGCHDQSDNRVNSQHAFPHSQTVPVSAGGSNARVFLWMNIAPNVGGASTEMADENMKSFDGACLKCHRQNLTSDGVGLSF